MNRKLEFYLAITATIGAVVIVSYVSSSMASKPEDPTTAASGPGLTASATALPGTGEDPGEYVDSIARAVDGTSGEIADTPPVATAPALPEVPEDYVDRIVRLAETPKVQADEVRSVTPVPVPRKAAGRADSPQRDADRLARLVDRATATDSTDAYLDELISEAVSGRTIAGPEAPATPPAEADPAKRLAAIVARAQGAGDGYDAAIAAEARVARVAPEADPGGTPGTDQEVYIVAAGDSLATIAQRFYDDAEAYPRILAANRAAITRADLIMVGQRLVIPR